MLIPVPTNLGYSLLGALVLGESAGLPVPGETAVITGGGLAAAGSLSLPVVIAVTVLAAIVGDTFGWWLGRRGGRAFLLRDGLLASHRRRAVGHADRLFERHGAATVFFGRFVPGVRVVAAVTAGAARMPWRRFAPANAAGALAWASAVATLAYAVGPTGAAGLAVAGYVIAGLGAGIAWLRARRRRAGGRSGRGQVPVATMPR